MLLAHRSLLRLAPRSPSSPTQCLAAAAAAARRPALGRRLQHLGRSALTTAASAGDRSSSSGTMTVPPPPPIIDIKPQLLSVAPM